MADLEYETFHTSPRFDASNIARTHTGSIVLLSPTQEEEGESDPVSLSKGTILTIQINDSESTSTVNILGSLDGLNYSTLATYVQGAQTVALSINYVPYVKVSFSGNTGQLSVLAI